VDTKLLLEASAGEMAQVDWGKARVVMKGLSQEVYVFCLRLRHSSVPFVWASPHERMEAFLEGHVRAFEWLGGVPRRLVYEYVPRNIFIFMLPAALCSGGPRQPTDDEDGRPTIPVLGHITITATRANSGALRLTAVRAWRGIPPKCPEAHRLGGRLP